MLGPEEIPYGSLGAYANAVATRYNLSDWQTAQFLIKGIPARDLPVLGQETYSQTAALADKPDSPDYYSALESTAWADRIETGYQACRGAVGMLGAVAGGIAGIAAQSTYSYNSCLDACTAEQVVSAEDTGFISMTSDISMFTAPVLAAGVAGAYLAKKCSPKVMKLVAGYMVKRIKAGSGPDLSVSNAAESTKPVPKRSRRSAAPPRMPSGSHLEPVEEGQLYQVAQRWANLRGCHDEQAYADFLLAEMSPAEIKTLVQRTKQRQADVVDGTSSLSRQDPRYANLLHDLQIARDIAVRTTETRNVLKKVYRGLGYLTTMCYFGFQAARYSAENDGFVPPASYSVLLFNLTQFAFLSAASGLILSDALADKTGYLTQRRARRLAAKASSKD